MGKRREWLLFFLCCGERRTAVSQKEKERTETTERKAKQRLRETCEISQPGNARALLEDRTKLKVQECVIGGVDEVRERNVTR